MSAELGKVPALCGKRQLAKMLGTLPGGRDKTTARAGLWSAAPLDPELQEALRAPPLAQYDISLSLEAQPLDDLKAAPDAAAIPLEPAPSHDGFSVKTASLFGSFLARHIRGEHGAGSRAKNR